MDKNHKKKPHPRKKEDTTAKVPDKQANNQKPRETSKTREKTGDIIHKLQII